MYQIYKMSVSSVNKIYKSKNTNKYSESWASRVIDSIIMSE